VNDRAASRYQPDDVPWGAIMCLRKTSTH
jgi:hypothetical protein